MQWHSRTTVQVTHHAHVFEIVVRGEVDYDECDLLHAAWAEADEQALPATVVDLSGVAFGDSGLLNALLAARRRHAAEGRALILLGPLQEAVRRLLAVSGTLDHFTVTDSRAAALGPAPGSASGP
ncbi:STAS domain-containing protein [Streptomyces tropicalis]|uniref:STAS domain-containing protein n=1 Tax=Streptomyces tropicalis TaxID=3034234 RepID=A0ABT6AA08_9ACTN|nr:STAS domain-containing protein [Streptomyces tropicalis]MDF3301478.1 STAS domain-containing protein [Streptomyces tropicalis]